MARGTRLHRLCTRPGPQCRSWSSRPDRAPPKPTGDLVGGLRAEAARWGARFRGLIYALEIRVSFSNGDGVAAAPAAASPPLLPTPPPMMPSRTTPFKHKATPFERFMHETMGVPDGKAQQWLKTEGKLAKLEGDPCRWPVFLPTAWKKMGFDASREEAVVRVAYVNPRCMRRIKLNEECSPNCTKCGTLWHDRLESGEEKVLSFD